MSLLPYSDQLIIWLTNHSIAQCGVSPSSASSSVSDDDSAFLNTEKTDNIRGGKRLNAKCINCALSVRGLVSLIGDICKVAGHHGLSTSPSFSLVNLFFSTWSISNFNPGSNKCPIILYIFYNIILKPTPSSIIWKLNLFFLVPLMNGVWLFSNFFLEIFVFNFSLQFL